jgi:hypothetical protein
LTEEKKEAETPKAEAEKTPENMTLFERVDAVIKAVLDKKLGKELDERVDKIVEARLKAKDIEIEEALRASFGVGKDKTLTEKDLPYIISAVRKAAVEKTEKERAPAIEKAAPDGNKTPDPIDKLFSLEEEKQ